MSSPWSAPGRSDGPAWAPPTGPPRGPDAGSGPPPAGERRPGRWVYVLGTGVSVLSVLIAGVVLVLGVLRATDVQAVPPTGIVTADAGEELGVYAEQTDVDATDGFGTSPHRTGSRLCFARDPDAGVRVLVTPALGTSTVSRGSRTWQAAGTVRVPAGGRLQVQCFGAAAGVGPPPDVLGTVGWLFLTIALGGLGALVGIVVVVVGVLLRRRPARPA